MDDNKTTPLVELTATVGDGKYTVEFMADGRLRALRYGHEWRDLTGDGMVLALVQEIHAAREKNVALQAVVDEAARCFFDPAEIKPGTWGYDVAWKLQELSTPPTPPPPQTPTPTQKRPYPDSPEGHEDAMLADEAREAMRNLPLVTPNLSSSFQRPA